MFGLRRIAVTIVCKEERSVFTQSRQTIVLQIRDDQGYSQDVTTGPSSLLEEWTRQQDQDNLR